MAMIRLVLVDDQPAARHGLRMRLALEPDLLIPEPGPCDRREDAEHGNVTVSAIIRLFNQKGTLPSTQTSARKRRSVRWPVLATSPLPSGRVHAGCSPPPKCGGAVLS